MVAISAADPLGIVGTVLDERYRVIGLADEGGFSTVYKAEHLSWDMPVAIKVFTALDGVDAELRERLLADFVREGKLMSELSSRSSAIVQARDVGRLRRDGDNWLPYLVLEWIAGESLDRFLERELRSGAPARDLAAAMRLLEPIAVALDVAHLRGIAHRDLKPANIVLVDDPRDRDVTAKLLDFGIAKVMAQNDAVHDALLKTGQQITAFTPTYGAPEQFSRAIGATGPWTDVYAMALILVELLRGGERGLVGESFFELGVRSTDAQNRPTPASFGLDVGAAAEAVFAKALAVDPAQRFRTMGDMWRALVEVVRPGEDTWRSPGSGRTTPSSSRTTPAAVSFAARTTPRDAPPSDGLGHRIDLDATALSPVPRHRAVLWALAAVTTLAGVAATAWTAAARRGALTRPGDVGSPAAARAAPAESLSAMPSGPSTSAMALGPSRAEPCPQGMSIVHGGDFVMGSNDTAFKLWRPAHRVTLDTFCLGVREVTTDEYAACVGTSACTPASTQPSFPRGEESEAEHQRDVATYAELCNYQRPERANHPINCVSWYQADAFCRARGWRLPSEAEWERAARGVDGRVFPWGNDAGDHTYMNAGGPEWKEWSLAHGLQEPPALMYEISDGFPGTAPVGTFPRAMTQTGQLDMVGNVWEWTADWYAVYSAEDAVNPKGPAAGDRKAIRGGGFNGSYALWLNPAFRYHQLAEATSHAIGFRCAANVAAAK